MIQGKSIEGWKKIAEYFDRRTRTVQMWERECGLPVHRFRGRVLAYPQELEKWRSEQHIGPRTGDPKIDRLNS